MLRGIYDRKYNVIDVAVQANKLTHILYAFANLQEDGQVVLGVNSSHCYGGECMPLTLSVSRMHMLTRKSISLQVSHVQQRREMGKINALAK